MLNDCEGSHDEYPSYKCYDYLSTRLDKPELSEDNKKNLKNALDSLDKDKNTEFFQPEIINYLAARIASDGAFYNGNIRKIVCNYINYKLNHSLRSHYNHIYTEDYDIFKTFIKAFYKKRHNNEDPNRTCENYIRYLNKDIYERMKILYKIYDHYNELKKKATYWEYRDNDDKLCSNLHSLIHYSNDAINQKIINEESISLIRNLKEIIENDKGTEPYKQRCKLNILKGMLTELPNSQVPISREEGSALVSHFAQKPDQPHELESQRGDAANEQASRQQESEDETAKDLATQQLAPQEPAAKVEEPGIHLNGLQAGIYPLINRQVTNDHDVTGLLKGRYRTQHPEAPTEGTESLLGKMQVFFTDTLGQVEPGPVLGVSGGMGALFLLFKYTPVGSFFGGRRGRFRQIPRSFNGPFPGAFPNFQEYDGGFIGYSPMGISPLAE
ncbi:PIR protein [Plasmodium vivax]|uniref:VIR protein n=1 Tax=Plasmodium vivax TaxID=5855 RepID=A0A565A6F7_PLAVI|nr:PIR protein [Plasmodium vivax]